MLLNIEICLQMENSLLPPSFHNLFDSLSTKHTHQTRQVTNDNIYISNQYRINKYQSIW